MKELEVNLQWEIDTVLPNCTNLALQEQPQLLIHEVSQRFVCNGEERKIGISSEHIEQDMVKQALYDALIADLEIHGIREDLQPDIDDMVLRWRPGSDRLTAWIDATLTERSTQ